MTELPDPYSVTPRKPLTNRQRLEMFIEHNGICCICGGKIGVMDRWLDEHDRSLWLDGTNDMDNRGPSHERCGNKKTAKEATERARGRKFAERHFGATRPKKPMPGSRLSKWKRTFSNGWVRRDET